MEVASDFFELYRAHNTNPSYHITLSNIDMYYLILQPFLSYYIVKYVYVLLDLTALPIIIHCQIWIYKKINLIFSTRREI